MPIVTLTSDFGWNDYYVALIKGAILCENQDINIIDISHNINNYDIVQGAFILKNSYKSFPKGTIHIFCTLSCNKYCITLQTLVLHVYVLTRVKT